jgi:hypothetical protein
MRLTIIFQCFLAETLVLNGLQAKGLNLVPEKGPLHWLNGMPPTHVSMIFRAGIGRKHKRIKGKLCFNLFIYVDL